MPRNPKVLINQGALGGAPVPRPRAENRPASAPPQNLPPQGNPPLNVQNQEAAREVFERVVTADLEIIGEIEQLVVFLCECAA
jgi:hypothetical protein